jgi:Protein of unknown function (DUF2652)
LFGRCVRRSRLAKFEGDAAFVYAVTDKVDGSLLQDSVEQAYFAFRRRLRSIKQANSCECRACRRMENLDVKFVVHHGEFIKQKIAGREELAGRDVILVHRLLKNEVNKKFGARLLESLDALGAGHQRRGLARLEGAARGDGQGDRRRALHVRHICDQHRVILAEALPSANEFTSRGLAHRATNVFDSIFRFLDLSGPRQCR